VNGCNIRVASACGSGWGRTCVGVPLLVCVADEVSVIVEEEVTVAEALADAVCKRAGWQGTCL